jgi:iron complex transport system substrate-binding protein
MNRRVMVSNVIAVAVTTALVAVGCTGGEGGRTSPPPAGPGSGGAYPVQIENCGRTLSFDRAPSRVITGYQPVLEVMVGLGLADRVLGRTTFDGTPLPEQEAAISRIPIVSKTNSVPPKEELLAQRADFVYSTGYSDFEAFTGQATLEDLDAVGTPAYIGGGACDPEQAGKATLQDTYTDILNIGKIFGVTDRAERKVAEMKATVQRVRTQLDGQRSIPVIFYSSGTSVLRLAGAGVNTEIIQLAGGRNIFADQEDYFDASREAVAGAGAEAFIISDYRPGMTGQQKAEFLTRAFPGMAAKWQHDWPMIDAVYTHPGWRHADAVEYLAKQLHPDLVQ